MKCSLDISNFLEDISSLSHSIVFLYFFALIRGRLSYLSLLFFGTLQSNRCIFPFLLCLSLLFFSQVFISPPQTTILPFCLSFSWGWSWSLPPVQCYEPPSIVLQALSIRSNPLNLFVTSLLIVRDLIFVIHEWSSGFPCFLQFESEFGSKGMFR